MMQAKGLWPTARPIRGYDRVYVNIAVDNVYAIPATGDMNMALIIAGIAAPVVLSAAIVVKKKESFGIRLHDAGV